MIRGPVVNAATGWPVYQPKSPDSTLEAPSEDQLPTPVLTSLLTSIDLLNGPAEPKDLRIWVRTIDIAQASQQIPEYWIPGDEIPPFDKLDRQDIDRLCEMLSMSSNGKLLDSQNCPISWLPFQCELARFIVERDEMVRQQLSRVPKPQQQTSGTHMTVETFLQQRLEERLKDPAWKPELALREHRRDLERHRKSLHA
ncbi:hypothetical protein AJ80_04534 [Polytolypa hystricis UAMH7299]|uniref:Uncharacterized protein n=1 Tax=Polytolypa hystricis (strain UAMH7299) TaxID=1447883 RepID=A0A2B7YC28_POLH7|nr:hypothetical protein AJ80_04534 [Polytolypa hystricis UAMH7299]